MAMTEIDFAALGLVDDAPLSPSGSAASGMSPTGTTSSHRRRKGKDSRGADGKSKKKGSHRRAHRRSTALNSSDSSSNLDFLAELDPLEVKKPSTRGLRNHANQMPVSYEQPAWMQYKQRAGADGIKKPRRSNGGQVYEGKTGGRTSPKRVNSLVGGSPTSSGRISVEGMGGGRQRLSAQSAEISAAGGEGKRSVANAQAAGTAAAGDGSVTSPAAAAAGRPGSSSRGSTPRNDAGSGSRKKSATRRSKHKSDKTKTNSLKSQTLPKKAATSLPSVNGMRSVASLMAGPQAQQRTIDLTMRAVGVTKKQHEKPVSMKKQYASGSSGQAFLRQLSPSKTARSPKTAALKESVQGFT
eukprot:INCI4306.1.p2 GENE.INCI4306.1~~INCI4306.1.p2  ORF type:complete len:355 (-),score=60.36 INCI4306.1:257-1321(-)